MYHTRAHTKLEGKSPKSAHFNILQSLFGAFIELNHNSTMIFCSKLPPYLNSSHIRMFYTAYSISDSSVPQACMDVYTGGGILSSLPHSVCCLGGHCTIIATVLAANSPTHILLHSEMVCWQLCTSPWQQLWQKRNKWWWRESLYGPCNDGS